MIAMQTRKYMLWMLASGGAIAAVVFIVLMNRYTGSVQRAPDAIHATNHPETAAPSQYGWVGELAMKAEFDPPLTPSQQSLLAKQSESLIDSYMDGDASDYIALMTSWGGWLREPYEEADLQKRWTQASHKFPWIGIERERWVIQRPPRNPETGGIDLTDDEFDGISAIQTSLFDFGDDLKALNTNPDVPIMIYGPVRSADGSRSSVMILMIWSPSLGKWLPSTLINQAQGEDSLPKVIF